MSYEPTQRDPYFDNIKGLLILLVFIGHFVDLYRQVNPACDALYQLLYLFHMPLFLFVSGLFSKNCDRADWIFHSFRILIIPAIPFEFLYFLIHWILKMDNFHQFLTPIFAYWYLFVLFMYRISLPILKRIRFILPVSLLIAILIGFNTEIGNYLSLERFFAFLPWYLLGYKVDRVSMEKLKTAPKVLGLCAVLLSAGIVLFLRFVCKLPFCFTNDTAFSAPIDALCRAIQFPAGIIMSIGVLILLPSQENLLTKVGLRSIQIYLLNFYIVAAFELVNPLPADSVLNFALCILCPVFSALLLVSPPVNKIYDGLIRITDRMITCH